MKLKMKKKKSTQNNYNQLSYGILIYKLKYTFKLFNFNNNSDNNQANTLK